MRILIVGSGVTGQATGKGFSKFGHDVIFYDIESQKLAVLKEEGYDVTQSLLSGIQGSDLVFVCVPTPTIDGSMDFTCVCNAIVEIAKALRKDGKYRVVVVRSTVLPSTTRHKVVPLLVKHSQLKAGKDFGVCMNPEFLREKYALQDFLKPDRIVIGEFDKKSGDNLEKAYSPIGSQIIRTDLDTAEVIKYASNLFLATKISFFNEMHSVCKRIGVDANVVGKAVSLDSRIGDYGVYGGRPFDGKCLPKDLEAFSSYIKSLNMNPNLLDAVSFVNRQISASKQDK